MIVVLGYLKPADLFADIVFLVDSSDDVTNDAFLREKYFVKQLARSLNIAPGKSRAALLTYSTNPQSSFNLEKYDTIARFEKGVDSVPYIGGTRRIDKALHAAANVLLEARPTALKIVVLLTTGKQTEDSDTKTLEEAVRPLQALGAMLYAVPIGKEPDVQELRQVFDDVVLVATPTDLQKHITEVTRHVFRGKLQGENSWCGTMYQRKVDVDKLDAVSVLAGRSLRQSFAHDIRERALL